MPDPVTVHPAANVKDCPKTAIGASWPWPVEQRIRGLVALGNSIGANTSKQELIAAIVATFEATPEHVDDVLRTYRTASAEKISLSSAEDDGVIHFERRRQGRPGRGSG